MMMTRPEMPASGYDWSQKLGGPMTLHSQSEIRQARARIAKAKALWGQSHFDEAIRELNAAVRRAPNDLAILVEASRALGAWYQIERGMHLLDRALRLGARRADLQHAVGETFQLFGQPAKAEGCFRRAIQLGHGPQSLLELARLCERRHALDEADELVKRALRGDPQSPDARLLQARIHRRHGELDQSLKMLRELTRSVGEPYKIFAEAFGELCTLLDSVGEYAAAWDAMLRGKQLQLARGEAAWGAAEFVLARCQGMLEAISADHFQRWQSATDGDGPQRVALLTGFPRSGTTLLEQVLDAHPDVVSSEEREVFSADVFPWLGMGRPADTPIVPILEELSPRRINESRKFYLNAMEAMLREPIGSRLHLDKNPAMNLMIPPMRRVFPELKLIVALRDPRDVVVSCFLRYLPVNPVSACFLTLERTVNRYLLDLGGWLKIRDMTGDWIEVRYEDTVADLPREARRALHALAVPWDEAVLGYRQRVAQKQVLSPTYEAVFKPVFTTSIGRWRNYERRMTPFLERLAPMVKALGYED
jgi:tetratricopeptide (TPR) repeat protein